MSEPIDFLHACRLPDEADNVAIAAVDLQAGSEISYGGKIIKLNHSVLEGHRFAVDSIPKNHYLCSWGLPFGRATMDIRPGNYVCNEGMLLALHGRAIDFNFQSVLISKIILKLIRSTGINFLLLRL